MTFYPPPRAVPDGLATEEFVLEPLTADHVEIDYDAVMGSRHYLRVWSGTSWPADDFTLDGNLADLVRHDREHRDREAFTYTMLSPNRSRCLGCVYVVAAATLRDANPDLPRWEDDTAVVTFWVRDDRRLDLERALFDALVAWFRDHWEFSTVLFAAHRDNAHQCGLIESRLPPRATATVPGEGVYVLHG